jgi:hypothetical protein
MRAVKHQSPPANKIGKCNLVITEVGFSGDEANAVKKNNFVNHFIPLKAD